MSTSSNFSSSLVFILAAFVIGLLSPSQVLHKAPDEIEQRIERLHTSVAVNQWRSETCLQYSENAESPSEIAGADTAWSKQSQQFGVASEQKREQLESQISLRDRFLGSINHPFRRPVSHWALAFALALGAVSIVPAIWDKKNQASSSDQAPSGDFGQPAKLQLAMGHPGDSSMVTKIEFHSEWFDKVQTGWSQARSLGIWGTVVIAIGLVLLRSVFV